jgi:hypothetical protein
MRLIPEQMTACTVRATDAEGIYREMGEIAQEQMALVLTPEQAKTLRADRQTMRRDLILHDEERE